MSILYLLGLLLLSVLCAAFWVVSISCAIAWYEYANRDPQLLENRFLGDRFWLAARLLAVETGSVLLTVCAYPFGWLPQRPPSPTVTTIRPVILLHGLFHNRACWFLLKQRLEQCGFTVVSETLPPWEEIDSLAARLDKLVEETCITYDVDKVHLVGHSMGGMLARYYVQMKGGERRVERCILLATPNRGSKLAPFAISPLGALLMPGSEFLRELEATPIPAGVRMISIYSHHDNLVVPSESAHLPGVDNIELEWLGHTSLLLHEESMSAVVSSLRLA